ncbi:MAG TPA: hypothetical protein VFI11_15450 [Anaerolineales bacterium]|nr:hypothetical protein [Anaerolineales bacterium]
MSGSRRRRLAIVVGVAAIALVVFPTVAGAFHPWNGYHWARTNNPFTLKLGDNVSGLWDSMLVTASGDWSQSTVLDTTVVAGGTRPKSCRPTTGRVEVCSARYGPTGWLGLAQIWISGSHITQGIVKNNDYYFGNSTYTYNNKAEMQHVICQEVGHTLGLAHQSEDGSSQNSCMDYYHNTSDSDLTSTHPNAHDYEQLEAIYAHLDGATTVGSMPANVARGDFSDRGEWGELVSNSRDGRESVFVRDFGRGFLLVTHVIWVTE